jgi:hypothetical protein
MRVAASRRHAVSRAPDALTMHLRRRTSASRTRRHASAEPRRVGVSLSRRQERQRRCCSHTAPADWNAQAETDRRVGQTLDGAMISSTGAPFVCARVQPAGPRWCNALLGFGDLERRGGRVTADAHRRRSRARLAERSLGRQRTSLDTQFGTARSVTELNSADADVPGWLSKDGCRLYFASDREGNADIFVATRSP